MPQFRIGFFFLTPNCFSRILTYLPVERELEMGVYPEVRAYAETSFIQHLIHVCYIHGYVIRRVESGPPHPPARTYLCGET